jgi:hypothetical protein
METLPNELKEIVSRYFSVQIRGWFIMEKRNTVFYKIIETRPYLYSVHYWHLKVDAKMKEQVVFKLYEKYGRDFRYDHNLNGHFTQ